MKMKKVMFALAAIVVSGMVNAMSVDWNFTGPASTEGMEVYVLSNLPAEVTSADVFAKDSLAKGAITKNGRTYYAKGTIDGLSGNSGDAVSLFYALVGSDGTDSYYMTQAITATLYNKEGTDQAVTALYDGSKTIAAVGGEGWTKIGGTSPVIPTPTPDVPEPTSGLLLLVGGAALALRRKQK